MRIALTGAGGFLGWHLRCAAFASGVDCVPVDRATQHDPAAFAAALQGAAAVVHCAGVNRGPPQQVTEGNLAAAGALAAALARCARPPRVVYANSVHATGDSDYGAAKRKAGELLAAAAPDGYSDVALPNLFGEHGRPHYHSFVATFCHEVAAGRRPAEVRDREVALLSAPDAAQVLLAEAGAGGYRTVQPAGRRVRVPEVLAALTGFDTVYRSGLIPDLADPLHLRLFHTYRSHLFPWRYPIPVPVHTDHRGSLVECVRCAGPGGQAFVSTTLPGQVRGEHVHLRKFERFLVVDGQAEIALRRLFTREMVTFQVSGERPEIVDMPTGWTHRLSNLDERPVTTFFWTNERYDAGDPDTFPCPVAVGEDSP